MPSIALKAYLESTLVCGTWQSLQVAPLLLSSMRPCDDVAVDTRGRVIAQISMRSEQIHEERAQSDEHSRADEEPHLLPEGEHSR